MKRYFITGTNTDCGKTYVTRKLTSFYSRAAAIKPVASGCKRINEQLISSDALQLQQHSILSMEQINPWRFEEPVSPHIAANNQGVRINVNEIAEYCLAFESAGIELLFIEGAGGLMVPLNEKETWIDFLQLTEIPVILVVGLTLGCINHALLTQVALDSNNVHCEGWIANCVDPGMMALDENIKTLENKLNFPLLATIPYLGELSDLNL